MAPAITRVQIITGENPVPGAFNCFGEQNEKEKAPDWQVQSAETTLSERASKFDTRLGENSSLGVFHFPLGNWRRLFRRLHGRNGSKRKAKRQFDEWLK